MSTEEDTYTHVLRSSSIVGGAKAVNYAISLARIKIVALLIGPSGIGLISLYTSAIALIGTVSGGEGIKTGGVREIARANGISEQGEIARIAVILRRACWASGVFGWLLTILLANPISVLMTGSTEHALAIAVLGSTLLLSAISSGQLALLQGLRRIGDLARVNIFSSLTGSIVIIFIYFFLRESGVLPALIATAAVSLVFSLWYSRRVLIPSVAIGWADTLRGLRRLLRVGLATTWGLVLNVAGLEMLTRFMIAHQFGIDAVGIYQAAWAVSGVLSSFILSSMDTDFYPRLTGIIHDKAVSIRAVNEQIEIGILLAMPGLLGALAFSSFIITTLYSSKFLQAADLLPWMALGIFSSVASWPMHFIILALGAFRLYAVTETIFFCIQAGLTVWWLKWFGPIGAAYAIAANYAIYLIIVFGVGRALIGFSWSYGVRKLMATSCAFVGAMFTLRFTLVDVPLLIGGGLLTFAGFVFCLRSLAKRLGQEHKISRLSALLAIPSIVSLFCRRSG